MKLFILSSLLLISAAVQAADVTVLEADLPALRGRADVDTKFYVDTETQEVFAKVNVTEEEVVHYPQVCHWDYPGHWGPGYPGPGRYGRYCRTPMPTIIINNVLKDSVRIENLMLVNDKVIYQGAHGEVVCGTMGRSRVFRIPTLYLSGKCDLEGRIYGSRNDSKVVVKFKVK